MKDRDLVFWTTLPNVFLVATTMNGRMVGCVSYKQITPNTVEMHRLSVDSEFRRAGIGQKLVKALIQTATNNGYEMLYLETTVAQVACRQLYPKMGFEQLHSMKLDHFLFDLFTGLHVDSYYYSLK